MREIRERTRPANSERDEQSVFRDVAPAHSMSSKPLLISVAVPCFNEEAALPDLYAALCALADNLVREAEYDTEFVLIDDGSCDRTWAMICALAARDSRVRGVRLSRNFGHQAALACGYALARGDAVVSLDADLQDPPEVIPEMLRAWREGADIVFGVRKSRDGDSLFKRATASLFYWGVNCVGGHHVRRNSGDFRLLSRRCVAILDEFPENGRFFREMVGWIGFPSAEVRYRRQPRRAGQTKYSLHRMYQLACNAMVSATTRPLRYSLYAAILALTMSVGSLAAAVWPAARGVTIPIATISFGTAIVLLGQAIQGLYLERVFNESRHRPTYLVSDCTDQTMGIAEWRKPRTATRPLNAADLP
jgi:glycosyltransferase involved in cell wall biosynthesis